MSLDFKCLIYTEHCALSGVFTIPSFSIDFALDSSIPSLNKFLSQDTLGTYWALTWYLERTKPWLLQRLEQPPISWKHRWVMEAIMQTVAAVC